MIAGRCVGIGGAGNFIYGKGRAALSGANAAFIYTTHAVAPGRASGCARGTIAPFAADCDVSQRVMVRIMYGDRYAGGP